MRKKVQQFWSLSCTKFPQLCQKKIILSGKGRIKLAFSRNSTANLNVRLDERWDAEIWRALDEIVGKFTVDS